MKTIKLLKITSIAFGIIAALGFIYLLGTVGAMDNNNIGAADGFKQCLIGLEALVAGCAIAGLASNEAEYRERMTKSHDSQDR